MRKIVLYLPLAVCALVCTEAQNMNMEARKLSMALYAAANLYVDSTNINKLTEDAIVGMLEKLDPHSNYLDPEETKEMTEPLQGNFDGIGIQFNMLADTLYVIQVIAGGPSEKVGLLAGDRMIMVDDTLIAGVNMKSTDVQKRLRGPKGTEVRVKILRQNEAQLIDFKITRGKIPVHSLDASYMADKQTGYVKLSRFALSSVNEFQTALAGLRKEGMKNLILDLQGNGGGYLNIAIDLADEFLGKGKLIVYTEGHNHPRENAGSTDKGGFEEGRLVILVDESSASASEILAGAVQDWDRGVIVGRRTFGKGLVQKPIPLPDGSMIRLTVSRYYTPTGRGIQKPYENGKSEDYNRDLIGRYNRGELMSADSIHFPDSLKFNTLLNKRIVYGGGGIMPDLFIPIDTARYTEYHRRLVANGLINRVAMNYLDRNRALLASEYPEFARYKDLFNVPETLMQELIALGEKETIAFDEQAYSASEALIKLQTKALIARDLYDMGHYYQIINEENHSYKAALQLINDASAYNKSLTSSSRINSQKLLSTDELLEGVFEICV
jgi:carboxyl-terminal processing protease